MDSATISGFSAEPVAVGLELAAHVRRRAPASSLGAVDEVEQHAAALDMAEEPVAEAGALMRALDQAGDVGEHELALVDARRRRGRDAAS